MSSVKILLPLLIALQAFAKNESSSPAPTGQSCLVGYGVHYNIERTFERDPYFSGWRRETYVFRDLPVRVEYRKRPLPSIEVIRVEEIKLPPSWSPSQKEQKLPAGYDMLRNATLVGRGGFKSVHLIGDAPEIPRGQGSSDQYSSPNREHLLARAPEVIKFYDPEPPRGNAKDMIRRDYAMAQILDHVTRGATLEGKPLVRMARLLGTRDELKTGVQRQEYIRDGVSVSDLARAINLKLYIEFGGPPAIEWANKILEKAKVLESDYTRMMEKIVALEDFLFLVHSELIRYLGQYGLGLMSSELPMRQYVQVPVDFRYGENVLWDPYTQMFVFVDA